MPKLAVTFAALLATSLLGCASQPKPKVATPTVEVPPVAPAAEQPKVEEPKVEAQVATPSGPVGFGPIYFLFDSSELSSEGRDTLERIADFLRKNAGARVTIAGHADERGTVEYNLALGDRRAQEAVRYLVRLGVEAERVRSITYGEERPAEVGEEEAAWSKNRRDEFEVTR